MSIAATITHEDGVHTTASPNNLTGKQGTYSITLDASASTSTLTTKPLRDLTFTWFVDGGVVASYTNSTQATNRAGGYIQSFCFDQVGTHTITLQIEDFIGGENTSLDTTITIDSTDRTISGNSTQFEKWFGDDVNGSDSNDGLDPRGFNLTNATYTNSTRALVASSAKFAGHTLGSDPLENCIYISWAGGTGWFGIESFDSDTQITLSQAIGSDQTGVTSSTGPHKTFDKVRVSVFTKAGTGNGFKGRCGYYKRGQTFLTGPTTGNKSNVTGPHHFTSFGSGADAIIDLAGNDPFRYLSGTSNTQGINNLTFNNGPTNGCSISVSKLTMHKVNYTNGSGIAWITLQNNPTIDQHMVDCTAVCNQHFWITNKLNTRPVTDSLRRSIIACKGSDHTNPIEHKIRVSLHKGVIAYSDFEHDKRTNSRRTVVRIQTHSTGNPEGPMCVIGNKIKATANTNGAQGIHALIQLYTEVGQPQNDVLIEGNDLIHLGTSWDGVSGGQIEAITAKNGHTDLYVRNNRFIFGNVTGRIVGVNVGATASDGMWFWHNTFYSNGAGEKQIIQATTVTNLELRNNIANFPNASSSGFGSNPEAIVHNHSAIANTSAIGNNLYTGLGVSKVFHTGVSPTFRSVAQWLTDTGEANQDGTVGQSPPLFTDVATDPNDPNLTLQAGSPCVDMAVDTHTAGDYFQKRRDGSGNSDIGYQERGAIAFVWDMGGGPAVTTFTNDLSGSYRILDTFTSDLQGQYSISAGIAELGAPQNLEAVASTNFRAATLSLEMQAELVNYLFFDGTEKLIPALVDKDPPALIEDDGDREVQRELMVYISYEPEGIPNPSRRDQIQIRTGPLFVWETWDIIEIGEMDGGSWDMRVRRNLILTRGASTLRKPL